MKLIEDGRFWARTPCILADFLTLIGSQRVVGGFLCLVCTVAVVAGCKKSQPDLSLEKKPPASAARDKKNAMSRAASAGDRADASASDTLDGAFPEGRSSAEEISTAHILITYQGARLAPSALTRTKEDAQARAAMIAKRIASDRATFFELAGRYSDSPSKIRGGIIAPLKRSTLIPGFDSYWETASHLGIGEVSKVIETDYGFHLVKRLALNRIVVRHILVAYTGAKTSPLDPRTKRQAKALVVDYERQLHAGMSDFERLAQDHSDDPSAKNGGLLPPLARGEMFPRFEQYAFALEPGQISQVVETPYGYHLIRRER